MKIAFIGPKQYAESLKLIGFEVFKVDSYKEALETVKKIREEYGIIFASKDILDKSIEGVVALPGLVKKSDSEELKTIVKKAIGKDIKI